MQPLTLYYNGTIHSFASNEPQQWLLCGGGKILASGKLDNQPAFNASIPFQKINLRGQAVLPAFTDAHTHFVATAMLESRVNLDGCTSLAQAIDRLAKAQGRCTKETWVRGGGYNRNLWQDGQPDKNHLDRLFPNQPVALESKDFHCMWVNSKALQIAGLNKPGSGIAGGYIESDADGSPTGLVYEKAMHLIYKHIPPLSVHSAQAAIRSAANRFLSHGITTVHSMEGLTEFGILQDINRIKALPLRVHQYIPLPEAEAVRQAGIRSGFGSDNLSIAGIKIFTDGSLGSQTAHMSAPYEGSTSTGVPHISLDDLQATIQLYNRAGLATAVHAIGDQAVRDTVKAYRRVAQQIDTRGLINRIEHAQLVPADLVATIKHLDLTVSAQAIHIADDVYLAEKYWGARSERAYPFRDLLDSGVNLAFGSDTPVADFNPFKGIYCALQRKYALREDEPAWQPQQIIALREALAAYTTGPARALGRMNLDGTLRPGQPADFVILDQSPFDVPFDVLPKLNVKATICGGKVVFNDDFDPGRE